MSGRDLIVVDVETTGLEEHFHVPLEIVAVNTRTGDSLEFVPFVDAGHLGAADGDAMRINRYYERAVYKRTLRPEDTRNSYDELWEWLAGNRFGGANPRFDAAMLRRGYALAHGRTNMIPAEPWHYRLKDLGAYAAGVLALPEGEVPSLVDVCELVGLDPLDCHTALGDAMAAAECFRRLHAKARLSATVTRVANHHTPIREN